MAQQGVIVCSSGDRKWIDPGGVKVLLVCSP
eukprot:CAMPEP_0204264492 /NCGR_PEP_ID=MMETSP0468-20130131/9060_1 /ASSEMBLY_ACC=CAM_ASM_000383 /TAXON_ID=2969 /ORGANISM="Oxyrrhis marina" /LENGTH=30 /DNA_ID= /DNA_START= /DNA_END= /DNA_ORIENTATION=